MEPPVPGLPGLALLLLCLPAVSMGEAGMLDTTFRPAGPEYAWALAVQPNGKILVFFDFAGFLNLNADGTENTAFFTPGVNGTVQETAIQKDGKILIAGDFSRVSTETRHGLARLHPDGALDTTFNPPTAPNDAILSLRVQPDGKILASGTFTSFAGSGQRYLARLHPDGSFDSGFRPVLYSNAIWMALQPDGKILVRQDYDDVPDNKGPLLRYNSDGTRDSFTLQHPFASSMYIQALAVQPDGKILVGGGNLGRGIARFHPDGSLDTTSAGTALASALPAGSILYDIALQADGKCVVCGYIDTPGFAHPNVALFIPDGSLDPSFTAGVDRGVSYSLLQADGRIIISGLFNHVGGEARNHFARLTNDPAFEKLQVVNASTVRWMRGGSAPEVQDVTFDFKPESSPDWTRLGTAARIPGGWELSGTSLPLSGILRAQGIAENMVMESTLPWTGWLAAWREQYFHTPDNSGDAADSADPDNDGLTNFTEFAFGLSPVDGGSNTIPEFRYDVTSFTATFTAPEGREDVIYGAEWSATMQPGTWTAIPDTGAGNEHTFAVSPAGNRVFARFAVKMR